MTNPYTFTDNPMLSGVSVCDTDIVNDNIMALKWMYDHITFRSIGEIVTSTIPLEDAGLHLLDGALIQGSGSYSEFVDYIAGLVTDYPDLFDTEANWQASVTQYGVCGKFVYDSVNNTVRLPKYGNQIYTKDITNTAPVIGNGKTLGLMYSSPNDNIGMLWGRGDGFSGAWNYANTSMGTSAPYQNGEDKTVGVSSNPQYSGLVADLANITTSLDGYYYIVIATTTKTEIEVDIDEIATDLNGKADVDLSNTNNTAKILMSGMGFPDNTYTDLTVGASGATYTAPANGWFLLKCDVENKTNSYQAGYQTSYGAQGSVGAYGYNSFGGAVVPMLKNQTLTFYYESNTENRALRFVYAKGSESEAS